MAEAITLGRMTDTMEEGFVAELSLKVGDTIKAGDSIAEIETDKATLPLESYYAGKILYVAAKKGDSLKIGDLIAIVGKEGEAYEHLLVAKAEVTSSTVLSDKVQEKVAEKREEVVAVIQEENIHTNTRLKASPLAKSIAKEKGIDLKKVSGSGEDGRIVKRDLESVSTSRNSKVTFVGKEGFSDLRVSQMRKTIAKRLLQSKNENPHFYLTVDINMDKAVELRTALNNVLSNKVSFNDIVIKAVAMALRQNMAANTSWLGDTIRQYEHIHIGMAVAVEDGLVVPVIRFADGKTIAEISEEAKSLAQKATSKKLLPPEMEGSTFTISNLGMFGIENFTAIINEPNACILAVGAIRKAPAVVNDEIKVANLMKVTLSSDHRVVDGAVGAKLLQSLKAILEEPVRLLI